MLLKLIPNFTSQQSFYPLQWIHVFFLLFIGYVFLTIVFYFFGYLENLDQRIIGVDSVYYYIYLPSIVFDFDVDFTNELAILLPKSLEENPSLQAGIAGFTENGLPKNVFSIGPAIFWFPFFLMTHLAIKAIQFLGVPIVVDPLSAPYTTVVYIANSFYGFIGILLTTLILKKYVKPHSALLASLAVMYATPLTFYFWSFFIMSHNVSFASTALFLLLWLTRGLSPWTAVAAGLMVLARWQNALFLLPLVVIFFIDLLNILKNKQHELKQFLIKNIVFAIILFLIFSPQLFVWWALYGKFILIPQGNSFINFSKLKLFPVLFSFNHGLFSWHPLLLLGFLGIFLIWKKHKILALFFLTTFLLQWLLNSAVDDWWAGWSFGHRRFINLLPFFALGLGFLFNSIDNFRKFIMVIFFVLFFTVWNQLFLVQYFYGLIPRGGMLNLSRNDT